MNSFLKKGLLLFFAAMLSITSQPLIAAIKQPSSIQQEEQLRKLQNYLNGIVTLRANFSQNNPDGTTSFGKFYLKRLGGGSFGKLRLEYAPPVKIKIIANGEVLRQEDGETKEVSDYSIDSTPASFLLRHKIDFFNDLEVKRLEAKEGKICLTVTRPGDEGITLTLVFVTAPMLRLQEWTVIDAQANKTHVTLTQVEIGISLEDALFSF